MIQLTIRTCVFKAYPDYLKNRQTFQYILKPLTESIGGVGFIVMQDVTVLLKRKSNIGRSLRDKKWGFGCIARGDTVIFFSYVKGWDTANLAGVFRRSIRPLTIVHSDTWSAYPVIFKTLSAIKFVCFCITHCKFYWSNNGIRYAKNRSFLACVKKKNRKYGLNIVFLSQNQILQSKKLLVEYFK